MYNPDEPIVVAPGIRREPIPVNARNRAADWSPDAAIRLVDGRACRISELVGNRELVLQFFYTRCDGTCPVTTQRLEQIAKSMPGRFGRSAVMLSISLDPERDTMEHLRRNKAMKGLPGWWNIARVERPELERLLDSVGFNREKFDPKTRRIVHASEVVFGSRRNRRWCVANAGSMDAKVVRELFLISWEGVKYQNPRRPGIELVPGRTTKV
ncbi:MAG: SCO family protein [Armatimonadota bacterium]